MTKKLESRLIKLLKLSNSENPHEAQSAIAKAKALADRNNIDISLLAIIRKENIMEFKKLPITFKYIELILIDHFGVKILHTRYQGKTKLEFFGTSTNMQQAAEVANYLDKLMRGLWANYRDEHKLETKARGSWMYGFYSGLSEKLRLVKGGEGKGKSSSEDFLDKAYIRKKHNLVVLDESVRMGGEVYESSPKLRSGATSSNTTINRPDVYGDGRKVGMVTNIPYNQPTNNLQLSA